MLGTIAKKYHAYTILNDTLEEYDRKMRALTALKDDALLLRHWNEIESIFDADFIKNNSNIHNDPMHKWSLDDVISLAIDEKEESIMLLVTAAKREKAVASKIDKYSAKWRSAKLDFIVHDDHDLLLLNISKSQTLLVNIEQDLLELKKVHSYRHAMHSRDDIQRWVKILSFIRVPLQQWLLLQNHWKRLGSIFSMMETEGFILKEVKRFNSRKKLWIKTVRSVQKNPYVVKILYDDCDIVNNIPYVQEQLTMCSESLSSFLSIQRRFPHFFFITDEELLEILSCKSNLGCLNQYVNLIFFLV